MLYSQFILITSLVTFRTQNYALVMILQLFSYYYTWLFTWSVSKCAFVSGGSRPLDTNTQLQ